MEIIHYDPVIYRVVISQHTRRTADYILVSSGDEDSDSSYSLDLSSSDNISTTDNDISSESGSDSTWFADDHHVNEIPTRTITRLLNDRYT